MVAVMRAILQLPIEQRRVLLRHIAIRLPMCGSHFSDTDFDKAVRVALRQVMVRMALQELAEYLGAYRASLLAPIPLQALQAPHMTNF